MVRYRQAIPKEKPELNETKLVSIPIDRIRPNPYQPRKSFSDDGIQELTNSFKAYGQLQPINVRMTSVGEYEIVAGERRLRAAKCAGWTHIDAIIISAYEQDSAIIALIENLQRENLHFLEEAEGFNNLLIDHGLTQDELAKRLGKNQSTIANKLRLLKLPKAIKDSVIDGRLTERHARALLRLTDENMQMRAIEIIKEKKLSVKDTEGLMEHMINKAEKQDPAQKQNVIRLFRDCRLFINSIKEIINQMRSSGLPVEYDMVEQDGAYMISITIPRK